MVTETVVTVTEMAKEMLTPAVRLVDTIDEKQAVAPAAYTQVSHVKSCRVKLAINGNVLLNQVTLSAQSPVEVSAQTPISLKCYTLAAGAPICIYNDTTPPQDLLGLATA